MNLGIFMSYLWSNTWWDETLVIELLDKGHDVAYTLYINQCYNRELFPYLSAEFKRIDQAGKTNTNC